MLKRRRVLQFIVPWVVLFSGSIPLMASDGVGLVFDHIKDDNGRTFLDKSIRADFQQAYAVGYLGNWQKGGEVGGYFFDSRRGAYSGYVRAREFDLSYQVLTEQPVARGYVAKMEFRFIRIKELERPRDRRNLFVYGLGFDKYYGDYSYFSATYFNDPRESGRFSVVVSNTFAKKDAYLRIGLVPRSDGTVGFFSRAKYRWVFIGYSYTREFDFSVFDRKVFSAGVKIPFATISPRN